VHWDLDKSEDKAYFQKPYFGNCDGVTCAELNPKIVVRVGINSHHLPGSNIAYSDDFGKTWFSVKMPTPDSKHGYITVSSDGLTWVWTPERSVPYYTKDKGEKWTPINDLPRDTRIVADRVNSTKFYGINLREGLLYTTTDGANSFTVTPLNLAKGKVLPKSFRGDIRGGQDKVYSTPGYENELWIAAYDGLYHSAGQGMPFQLKPKVTEIHGFGYGKEAPGNNYPALYLIGVIDGMRGIFRSDDKAQSWVRINDDQHQWGLLLHVTGDPKKYGRVYVGTHGRGILYGDPE
jgi:hypothetical protein